MNDLETKKAEAVKKCLLSVLRLGTDMAGLTPFQGGQEKQLLRGAYAHLEHIVTNLNGMMPGREAEPPKAVHKQEHKRSRRL